MGESLAKIRLGTSCDSGGIAEAKRGLKDICNGATDVKNAFGMVADAVKAAWRGMSGVIKSAFNFETTTTQFKTLIGNIDDAREHMRDLKELGDTPPFSLKEFAAASRALMVMTDGALGYKNSLELVGDAAAATGVPLEQMGRAVGRLYALIRDGEPVSRAVMELRNMGAITPEVASRLQALQKAGAGSAEIWGEVEKALGRYNGAMKETEKTGNGLMGAIGARWDNIVRRFGEAFMDSAKGGLQDFLDKAEELETNGTLDRWAEAVARALGNVVSGIKTVIKWIGKAVDAFVEMQQWAGRAGSAIGAGFAAFMDGGDLDDALDAASNQYSFEKQREEEQEREQARKDEEKRRERERQRELRKQKRDQQERERIQANLKREEIREDVKANKARIEEYIEQLQKEIREIEQRRELTSRSMGVDRQNHSWNPYQYHVDRKGNIDFIDWQRAKRYGSESNDEAKNRRRQEREDKRMEDLETRHRNGEKLSDREMRKLQQWWEYKEERDGKEKREKQIEAYRKEIKRLMEKSKEDLDEIRKRMTKLVDEGPLD